MERLDARSSARAIASALSFVAFAMCPLVVSGCNGDSGLYVNSYDEDGGVDFAGLDLFGVDLARPFMDLGPAMVDIGQPIDLARPIDFARPIVDLSLPIDFARPIDLARPPVDLARPIDLTLPIDLARPVDLARPIDFALPIDLARVVDLARPVDLTQPGDIGGAIDIGTNPIDTGVLVDLGFGVDLAQSVDMTSTDLALPATCGTPGDPGNELGVGKYCTTQADCAGTQAQLCVRQFFPGYSICTKICQPNGANTCGTAATCRCVNAFACGCFPDQC